MRQRCRPSAQTQGNLPLDLMRALMSSSGSTTSGSQTGAQPNLVQTLGQITPLLGAAGGAFSSPAVSGQPGYTQLGTSGLYTPSGQNQGGLSQYLGGLFG